VSELPREYWERSALYKFVFHKTKTRLTSRDCGVYFKRMRAAGEFDEAREDFEEFISAQGLDW
jgi:hypothetical protein